MPGRMLTIQVDGVVSLTDYDRPPPVADLRRGVGDGHLELVPYFVKIHDGILTHECVAFCNEEGKLHGLPLNAVATRLWHQQCPGMIGRDELAGPVVVLWGDAAFMRAL
jgi:hypothetical protein